MFEFHHRQAQLNYLEALGMLIASFRLVVVVRVAHAHQEQPQAEH